MSKGFDVIAPIYDSLARFIFGSSIVQSQLCFLPQLKNCKTVLVLGGGTGWWLNDLRKINLVAQIVFIDSSAHMLKLARKNISDDRIEFICGSVDAIPVDGKFDAVIMYNFMDLFLNESLLLVLNQIKSRTENNALWLVADFVSDKIWHKLFLRIMYVFFYFFAGLTTQKLPDWKEQLNKIGLQEVKCNMFYGGFIHSCLFQ